MFIMAKLFKDNIIKNKLQNFEINWFEEKLEILKSWDKLYTSKSLQTKKEEELEAPFWDELFWKILWYKSLTEDETYNRKFQPKVPEWWQKSDLWLGFFGENDDIMKVVIELKDANTSLDKPQQRAWNLTPVQQAFKYKPYFKECDFVIVSNFYEIRLYIDSYYDFETWTLSDLVNPKDDYFNFRKFYYLLCKENLITKKWDSNTKSLISLIRTEEKEITKKFYKEYSLLRKELFKDIVKNNSWKWLNLTLDKALEKAQKIIDRIIFIHFCEDTKEWLLPNWKLKENILRAWEFDFTPWEVLKKFFKWVDSWSEKLWIPEWYNWWLFHEDKELDSLIVWDEICKKFVDLWEYDFANDLSVNILGHIFEQSISDIEEIKSKINTDDEENIVSKRKKDGIFYTPEYIVDYIVKNSVWKKIDEWEEELKEKHWLKEDINDKNYQKRAIEVYTELQEKVQNIKVLDPACGSGAFLVKVFDFLLEKNKEIAKKLDDLWINQGLFSSESHFKTILQNNIYWVDLNEESVEITKLSLWLKTAQKGKKLANLDSNIKCWNSLIDDESVAWSKAFVWEIEFPFCHSGLDPESRGFDVVVGNPPYVTTSLWKWFSSEEEIIKFYKSKYKLSSAYKVNLYLMFLELWINLLNNKWYISFIIPNTIYLNYFYSNFRKYLIENFYLKSLFNLEYEVFEDTDIWWLAILLIQNNNQWNTILKHAKCIDDFNIPIENIIKQEKFLTIPDNKFIFSTNLIALWNKAYVNSITLWDWDFQFYNWIKSWDNKKFLSINKESEIYKEVIRWRDFYKYTPLNFEFYIKYIPEELWSNTNSEMYYVDEKLIIRQTSDHLVVSYDNNKHLTMDTTHLCFPLKDNFKTKFILVILNSKLLNFLYQIIVPEIWKTFSEVKIVNLKKLPIKNIPLSQQISFIEKADFMLDKNKELQEKLNSCLEFLQARFSLEKASTKLEKFYLLDFVEFKKALGIKKITMTEDEDLMNWFKTKKEDLMNLKNQIDDCDREIDNMVFDLYELSEEERKVVLGS